MPARGGNHESSLYGLGARPISHRRGDELGIRSIPKADATEFVTRP